MPCATHAVQEVHISLSAAVANAPLMEYFPPSQYLQSFLSELFVEPREVREIKDGCVYVPQGPGLGLELNTELVERYTVNP